MRCFLGIPLQQDLVGLLARVRITIIDEIPDWRGEKWVRDENLHATAGFLGEIDQGLLPDLTASLDAGLQGVQRFSLAFRAVQPIPSHRRCRMLWARFDDSDNRYADLAVRTETAVRRVLSLPAERRESIPHVTLCRARSPKPVPTNVLRAQTEALSCDDASMSVARVTLFSSRLTPRGPEYEALDSWELGGRTPAPGTS